MPNRQSLFSCLPRRALKNIHIYIYILSCPGGLTPTWTDGQASPLKAYSRDAEINTRAGRGAIAEEHSTRGGVYTQTPLQINGYGFLKGIHLMKIDKYLQRTITQKVTIRMK